jgi:hypothetical protein
MLTSLENCKIFYMVSTELAHPDLVHYNNRHTKMIETKKKLKYFMEILCKNG